MALSLKHSFQLTKADGPDNTVVQPSDWNAEHAFTAAAGKVLGTRTDSTSVTELPIAVDTNGNVGIGVTSPAAKLDINGTLGINGVKGTSGQVLISGGPSAAPSWGAVATANIADGAVTTVKIADANVTTAKLADANITTAKLADGSVTAAKLAAGAIPSGFSMPSGVVIPFAGTAEPDGWLFCYGQAVSRTTYAALFAVLGTTYGAGDSATTFNLPDLRGRVVAGQDDMGGSSANRLTNQSGGVDGDVLGAAGGAETHTLTIAQMPSHNHTSFGPSGSGSFSAGGSPGSSGTSSSTGFTGGGGAHNNVQPTLVLNYIIKT